MATVNFSISGAMHELGPPPRLLAPYDPRCMRAPLGGSGVGAGYCGDFGPRGQECSLGPVPHLAPMDHCAIASEMLRRDLCGLRSDVLAEIRENRAHTALSKLPKVPSNLSIQIPQHAQAPVNTNHHGRQGHGGRSEPNRWTPGCRGNPRVKGRPGSDMPIPPPGTVEHSQYLHRVSQRNKQIHLGKLTQGYQNYRAAVPINRRDPSNADHVTTPRSEQICSKRSWDSQVRTWRRALHGWDDVNSDDGKDDTQDVEEDEETEGPAGPDASFITNSSDMLCSESGLTAEVHTNIQDISIQQSLDADTPGMRPSEVPPGCGEVPSLDQQGPFDALGTPPQLPYPAEMIPASETLPEDGTPLRRRAQRRDQPPFPTYNRADSFSSLLGPRVSALNGCPVPHGDFPTGGPDRYDGQHGGRQGGGSHFGPSRDAHARGRPFYDCLQLEAEGGEYRSCFEPSAFDRRTPNSLERPAQGGYDAQVHSGWGGDSGPAMRTVHLVPVNPRDGSPMYQHGPGERTIIIIKQSTPAAPGGGAAQSAVPLQQAQWDEARLQACVDLFDQTAHCSAAREHGPYDFLHDSPGTSPDYQFARRFASSPPPPPPPPQAPGAAGRGGPRLDRSPYADATPMTLPTQGSSSLWADEDREMDFTEPLPRVDDVVKPRSSPSDSCEQRPCAEIMDLKEAVEAYSC
eukprot:TRINITY_DN3319_c0_g1_i2.p1 TRINITY_DN3319_c0_g1~~TRINITY_DN3319_c0_g1_i2.p1  ORF type:complete len:685 (+),score=165.31 TRINITY_DN3319_c0_g1_i2:239-2293(+)